MSTHPPTLIGIFILAPTGGSRKLGAADSGAAGEPLCLTAIPDVAMRLGTIR